MRKVRWIVALVVTFLTVYAWRKYAEEVYPRDILRAMHASAGGWKRTLLLNRLDPLRVYSDGPNHVVAMDVQNGVETGYYVYGRKSSTLFSVPTKWNMSRLDYPQIFAYRRNTGD